MSPASALDRLHDRVLEEGEPLAAHAVRSGATPAFGELAAAGPRTAKAPGEYAFVVEAVREGYLCHYGESRVLADPDPDLALLAGDLFYAIGISGLAGLDDPESVGILSDLIRVAAELRAEGEAEKADALWLAQLLALTCGIDAEQRRLVEALERADNGALRGLIEWSAQTVQTHGLGRAFEAAQDAIDSRPSNL